MGAFSEVRTQKGGNSAADIRRFHDAVQSGDAQICLCLIAQGVDVNSIWVSGGSRRAETPIHAALRAARWDNTDRILLTMRILIDARADVNKPDEGGKTPIYLAAATGTQSTFELSELLLARGAGETINKQNNENILPVWMLAGVVDHSEKEKTRLYNLYFSYGANPSAIALMGDWERLQAPVLRRLDLYKQRFSRESLKDAEAIEAVIKQVIPVNDHVGIVMTYINCTYEEAVQEKNREADLSMSQEAINGRKKELCKMIQPGNSRCVIL